MAGGKGRVVKSKFDNLFSCHSKRFLSCGVVHLLLMLRSSSLTLTHNSVCVCVYISLRMAVSVCVCVALARELKVACLGLYMSAIILSYVA